MLEEEVHALEHWSSARPSGSLVVTGAGLRVHIYRHGADAEVDLDSFRLDDARASATQRLIAESNSLQMLLPGLEASTEQSNPVDQELPELVILHAGNPEDGCCAIWIGAPIAADEIRRAPWAWIEPLWLAEPSGSETCATEPGLPSMPRHAELPEPVIALEPIVDDGAEER
jgi:hypothetical protein